MRRFPLTLAFLIMSTGAVQAQVAVQDSLALVAIYNATDGPNWRSDPGWFNGPVSGWGYLAVENNRVTGLGLAQLDLKGTLPEELGDLTELRGLGLEFNQLTGPLPESIGNLTNLELLTVQRNSLSGPIPESFGNLVELREFVFWGNQFTALPSTIGNLKKLTILNGFENQLSALPDGIGGLTALRTMMLTSNALTGSIPVSIGNITTLQELDLSYNEQLSGPVPATIKNLWQLQRLYLYDTSIEGPLPSDWSGMVSLERLWIHTAALTGSIPASIGDLPMLEDLNLANNNLSGAIPAGLGNTPATYIYLHNNQLSGEIPSELGNASNLSMLMLTNNNLSGAVPATLASMQNLTGLNIKDNDIEELPDFTNTPYSNFRLDVSGNRLHFDDLQLNAGVTMTSYAPQQKFDVVVRDMGTEWAVGCAAGGTDNSYQWFFADRTGASNNSQSAAFVIPKSDTRQYYCEAKNAQFVDLILESNLWPPASTSTLAPIAAITTSTPTGTAPFAVSFDGRSSSDPDGGSIVSWAWDFGDGNADTGALTTNMYMTAGSYTVVLTVTDDEGETDTESVVITVTEPEGGGPTEDGLILHIPFDGSARDVISGAETPWASFTADHNGTPNAAAHIPADSYLHMPIVGGGTSGEAYSVGGWFRSEEVPGTPVVLASVWAGTSSATKKVLFMSDNAPYALGVDILGAYIRTKAGTVARADGWFHVMVTTNGTRQNLYVNGLPVVPGIADPIQDQIMLEADGFVLFNSIVEGIDLDVDDFRIYDRNLSQDEVLELVRPGAEVEITAAYNLLAPYQTYAATDGGFVFGTNIYGDRAKAQLLSLPSGKTTGTLSAIRFWMGYSHATGSAADATVAVWSGTAATGPDQLLYESPVINLVTDEQGDYMAPSPDGLPTPISFVLPDVEVGATFYVAVHFEEYASPGDLYGLASGEAVGSFVEGAWEMDSFGNWSNISNAWWGGQNGAILWIDATELVNGEATAVESDVAVVPAATVLLAAYPNPFNPTTVIPFELAEPAEVRLSVYDVLGREVARLVDGNLPAGRHTVRFQAENLASGTFLVRLWTGKTTLTRSMVLVR